MPCYWLKKFFTTFTTKTIADTNTTSEVITALMVGTKEEVDRLADDAFNAGAKYYRDTEDMGFMYLRTFQDPDGHLWEVGWMDPNHVKQNIFYKPNMASKTP